MANKNTIAVSRDIDNMLGKLWVDGDISSKTSNQIMEVVNNKLVKDI